MERKLEGIPKWTCQKMKSDCQEFTWYSLRDRDEENMGVNAFPLLALGIQSL